MKSELPTSNLSVVSLCKVLRSRNPDTNPDCHAAADEIERLRAMLEKSAGILNGLRADVEHTLWPDSGFAAPEPRDG